MSKVFFQLTLVKNIGILIVIWVSRLQNPISPLCLLEGKVWALSMLKRFERTFQWSNGDHMLQDCTHLTIQFQSPVILQMINCYYFRCTNIRFKHAQYSKGCELYLCASSITQRHEMLKGAINPPWDGWNYCKLAAMYVSGWLGMFHHPEKPERSVDINLLCYICILYMRIYRYIRNIYIAFIRYFAVRILCR